MRQFNRIVVIYAVIFLVINSISLFYHFVFKDDYNWVHPYSMSVIGTVIVFFLKKEKSTTG